MLEAERKERYTREKGRKSREFTKYSTQQAGAEPMGFINIVDQF
jgi:hypothetical protein